MWRGCSCLQPKSSETITMVSCIDSFVQKDFADAQRDKQVNRGHWVFLEYMYSPEYLQCSYFVINRHST